MAIERYTIQTPTDLLNFLLLFQNEVNDGVALFGDASLDEDEESATITCKDFDDNIIFTAIQDKTVGNLRYKYTAFKSETSFSELSINSTTSSYSLTPVFAYKVGNCFAIELNHSIKGVMIFGGMSNDGKAAFLLPVVSSNTTTYPNQYRVAFYGADISMPDNRYTNGRTGSNEGSYGNNAMLSPILLSGGYNDVLYTPSIYAIYVYQYNIPFGIFEIIVNNKHMLTNGYIAVEDTSTTQSM